jgi:hypothetical protein
MAELPTPEWLRPRWPSPVTQRSNLSKGNRGPDHWLGGITSGLRSRLRVQVRAQVRVRESGPEPVPEPENLNLIPDGRDLGPENDFMPAAFYPVSGLPLRLSRGRADHPRSAAVERGRSTLPDAPRSARSADPTHVRFLRLAVSGWAMKIKRAPAGALLISPCPRVPLPT